MQFAVHMLSHFVRPSIGAKTGGHSSNSICAKFQVNQCGRALELEITAPGVIRRVTGWGRNLTKIIPALPSV